VLSGAPGLARLLDSPHGMTTPDLLDLLQELVEIGIAITSQRDLSALLPRIVCEAQRFARAAPCSCATASGYA
jgi:hypothetical protein